MGGVIPLGDATRRPTRFPVVTASLILVNGLVFLVELFGGDGFVARWSVIPADISAGHHWITILTAMFMHASWSHIIGNMVFLWAFGPEVEDLMSPRGYLVFYLLGGVAATMAQLIAGPDSTVPNLGASGAIAAVLGAFLVTYPRDRIRSLLFIFVFVRLRTYPPRSLSGYGFSPSSSVSVQWPSSRRAGWPMQPISAASSSGPSPRGSSSDGDRSPNLPGIR